MWPYLKTDSSRVSLKRHSIFCTYFCSRFKETCRYIFIMSSHTILRTYKCIFTVKLITSCIRLINNKKCQLNLLDKKYQTRSMEHSKVRTNLTFTASKQRTFVHLKNRFYTYIPAKTNGHIEEASFARTLKNFLLDHPWAAVHSSTTWY